MEFDEIRESEGEGGEFDSVKVEFRVLIEWLESEDREDSVTSSSSAEVSVDEKRRSLCMWCWYWYW